MSHETGSYDKKISISISVRGRDFYFLLNLDLNLFFVKSVVDALGICAIN